MEEMRGQYMLYKDDKQIGAFCTIRYDAANKSGPHIQGAITKRIKREIKKLGADYAEVYIHYSVSPSGPFCTRAIGRVQP